MQCCHYCGARATDCAVVLDDTEDLTAFQGLPASMDSIIFWLIRLSSAPGLRIEKSALAKAASNLSRPLESPRAANDAASSHMLVHH